MKSSEYGPAPVLQEEGQKDSPGVTKDLRDLVSSIPVLDPANKASK